MLMTAAAKVVRGLRSGLTGSERQAAADADVEVVRKLPDDPWKLVEPLPQHFGPVKDLGASTPSGRGEPKSKP
jgi:hypothetical protein